MTEEAVPLSFTHIFKQDEDRIKSGQVGTALGGAKGLLGAYVPPITVSEQDGKLRFERSPHLSLSGEDHDQYQGGRPWEVSS